MRKNLMKVAVLAGLGLVGQLAATDFRAPIATQMGPLHYSFDKLHKKKSNFTYFTTAHFRETEDAFMKHGTETHPLSQLIFGKDEFTISESFENGQTWELGLTENYNPYLKTTKLAPRVSYSEAGVFFGASWDYPVWNNKGRIGIRGSLPIRWVRMERDNEAEQNALDKQEDAIKAQRQVPLYSNNGAVGAPTQNTPGVMETSSSYRLAFLRGLLYKNNVGAVRAAYIPDAAGQGVWIGNTQSGLNLQGSVAGLYSVGTNAAKTPFVVIDAAKSGQAPYAQVGALLVQNAAKIHTSGAISGNLAQTDNDQTIVYPNTFPVVSGSDVTAAQLQTLNTVILNVDGSGPVSSGKLGLDGDKAAVFVARDAAGNNVDYSKLDVNENTDLWVTTVHATTDGVITGPSGESVRFIDNLISYYSSDLDQWLADRGFVIATDEQTGLGDIPAEIFYEHSFNDKWRGELCLGVKFPTGNGGSDYAGNPFRVQMGNGSHWEIKIGALAAWQAIRCMNVKLDLSYNFALEKTEHRAAAYKGATIKNFGPQADASVDWGYFIGNLDFNFTHPKSKKINGMIGYQLYYKTEDHIDFKDKAQSTHWLGQRWTQADGKTAAGATEATKGTMWAPFDMTLDGGVARMGTESWGHRVRLEGSYNLSKYMTTSIGGLYTFAGQNLPVEADVHCACQIRF